MESPEAVDGSGDFAVEVGRLEGMGLDDQSAALGIGFGWEIDGGARLALHLQYQIVRKGAGENQGSAFRGKHELRLAGAQDLAGFDRAQRRRRSGTDWRHSDHKHRLWISEGWRIVEPQVQFIFFRKRQRRDVLVLGSVSRAQNADDIDDRPDVRTVEAAPD